MKWDKGLHNETKDAYKIILRFLWDNPNASAKSIAGLIQRNIKDIYNLFLKKMMERHLICRPAFARYAITEEGMKIIGIQPKKNIIETEIENNQEDETAVIGKLEEQPLATKAMQREIVVEPNRQIKITIEIR